jgi:hypothetical protein
MKRLLAFAAVLGLGLVGLPASATPLFPTSISQLAAPDRDIIQVKKKWKGYKSNPGRKIGWRGRGMPPGQYKKYHRW